MCSASLRIGIVLADATIPIAGGRVTTTMPLIVTAITGCIAIKTTLMVIMTMITVFIVTPINLFFETMVLAIRE